MTESISDLLQAQYDAAEAYANAQIRLSNAFIQRSSSSTSEDLRQALEQWDSCRQAVQANMKLILAEDEFCARHAAHLELSHRVVETIARNPSWGSMGLPSHTAGILEENTVALAALRASIGRVNEIES